MRRFALGFVASALFLLPWVYLVLRTDGHAVSSRSARVAYLAVYTTWGLSALQPFALFLAFSVVFLDSFGSVGSAAGLYAAASLIVSLFACTFIKSYRGLRSQWREDALEANTDEKGYPVIDFRKAAYLKPFLWAYLWTALGSLYHWGLVVPQQVCGDPRLYGELIRNLVC